MMAARSPLLSLIRLLSGIFKVDEVNEKKRLEPQTKNMLYSKIIMALIRRLPLKKMHTTIYVKIIARIEPTVFENGEIVSYVSGTYRMDRTIGINRLTPGLYVQNISAIDRM